MRATTPNSTPSRATVGADLGDPLEQHGGDLGGLLGEHGDGAGLDDPGLLDRDRGRVVAEVLLVVDRDRQHDGDVGVDHVGRVPAAAHPDLDDGDVDRRVGEGGVGHPDDRLEEAQRVVLLGVDEVRVRRDVVEGADEALVVERLAVDADPLAHPLEVRGGEAAGAQVERAQQRLDHPAGAGLAVGAGQVHRPERPLRLAEQLGEGLDPVEARLELGLRPAGQQGVLDLGEGLRRGGRVGGVRGQSVISRRV